MAIPELVKRLLKVELARIGYPDARYDPVQDVMQICPDDERMPTISEDGIFRYGTEHDQMVKEKLYPMMDRVKEIAGALGSSFVMENKDIYILSSCNQWKEYGSMKFIAATTDRDTLTVLIAKEIMECGMGYGGETGFDGFTAFKHDCVNKEVDFNKLNHGFIQTASNALYTEPETMPVNCDEILRLLEQDENTVTMDSLKLDSRSLIFSTVELDAEYNCVEYYAPGIPDKYNIEDTDGFQQYVENLDEDIGITVNVRSYSVGRGESEYPGEDELEFIRTHEDELNKKYGIDCIQSDSFTHFYEPEEEY